MPFWDPVFREDGDRLVLSPKRFYLLMSNEAVSIPPEPGGRDDGLRPDERRAADPLRRLLRPGFRVRPDRRLSGVRGPRSRCVPTTCPSWSRTARRCASSPSSACSRSRRRLYGSGIGSSYQQQEETLSRYFRRSSRRSGFSTHRIVEPARGVSPTSCDVASPNPGSSQFFDHSERLPGLLRSSRRRSHVRRGLHSGACVRKPRGGTVVPEHRRSSNAADPPLVHRYRFVRVDSDRRCPRPCPSRGRAGRCGVVARHPAVDRPRGARHHPGGGRAGHRRPRTCRSVGTSTSGATSTTAGSASCRPCAGAARAVPRHPRSPFPPR